MKFVDTDQQTLMLYDDIINLTYHVGPLETPLLFKDNGIDIGYVVYNMIDRVIEKFEIFKHHRSKGYSYIMMESLLEILKTEMHEVELTPISDDLFNFYAKFNFKRYKRFWKRNKMRLKFND
jgi:hypothetical protein